MKKQILIGMVILLAAVTLCAAQEPEIQGTASLTYTGKYVWRGFNVYGAKTAIHPMLDLFMPGTGVGFSAEGHRANSSGYEVAERWDYSLYYLGRMFPDESIRYLSEPKPFSCSATDTLPIIMKGWFPLKLPPKPISLPGPELSAKLKPKI